MVYVLVRNMLFLPPALAFDSIFLIDAGCTTNAKEAVPFGGNDFAAAHMENILSDLVHLRAVSLHDRESIDKGKVLVIAVYIEYGKAEGVV